MICVSLGKISFDEALRNCREEELVEIRADLAEFRPDQFEELFKAGAAIVFTCRKSSLQESKRVELYKLALDNNVRYVDFDYEVDRELFVTLKPYINKSATDVILSFHDYNETPHVDHLKEKMAVMKQTGADVTKIACMVNSDTDLTTLVNLYNEKGRKIILGMGEKGILTRVAALFMGAEFTFAFPEGGEKTAPGQLTKRDYHEILKIMQS